MRHFTDACGVRHVDLGMGFVPMPGVGQADAFSSKYGQAYDDASRKISLIEDKIKACQDACVETNEWCNITRQEGDPGCTAAFDKCYGGCRTPYDKAESALQKQEATAVMNTWAYEDQQKSIVNRLVNFFDL